MNFQNFVTQAIQESLGYMRVVAFLEHAVEVVNDSPKDDIPIATLALAEVIQEKLPNISKKQANTMVCLAFQGDTKSLIKFLIKNNIKLECECENCKPKTADNSSDILPQELIDLIKQGGGEIKITTMSADEFFQLMGKKPH